jgi:hypothetical protein
MRTSKAAAEENVVRSGEQDRLEEMKVELALLNDITTFPYSLGTSVSGALLELYGFVPDDSVRKRALELARHNTMLTVKDSLGIRSDSDQRPNVRPAPVLRQEGGELLQKSLRGAAKQISLEARADGVIVLTGSTDSMESRVEASQLFRQLSGCTGVDNKLTVEQIEQNGHRMVKVTRDGSLLVPSSVLKLQSAPLNNNATHSEKVELANFPVASATANQTAPRNVPPPPPLPGDSLNGKGDELQLPTAIVPRQSNTPTKPSTENMGRDADALAATKLPVKWRRPAGNWETQLSQLETARKPPTPSRTDTASHADFAVARTMPAPDMTWRNPGGNEESEPKSTMASNDYDAPSKNMLAPTQSGPPLRSSHHWPPAYVTGRPISEGRPGVILFEDDTLVSKAATAPPVTRPAIVPSNLLRQVKSLCGRQARDVSVNIQNDGTLLVKVKVANRSLEDQLSRKILTIPDMGSPKVRLMMEVEP